VVSTDQTPEPESAPGNRASDTPETTQAPDAPGTSAASGSPGPPHTPDAAATPGATCEAPEPGEASHARVESGTLRPRRSALLAVSVAVAVLLAGGGGAYWASTAWDSGGGDGGRAAGPGNPPPLRLDGYVRGGPVNGNGIAPGEPNPYGTRYRADGPLPDGPDSAPVYRPRGEVTRAQAEQLAKALGVPGAPRLAQEAWRFGLPRDGSGPALEVGRKAPGTWSYVRYGRGGVADCYKPPVKGPKAGEDTTAPSPSVSSSPAARCPSPGGLPRGGNSGPGGDGTGPVSEEKAKKAAAPVLNGIGLSDAKLDASQTIGAVRVVNANPVLDGLPTYGWQTGLQIGSDGRVVAGTGQLAQLKKGPGYPVLSAEETLRALNNAGRGRPAGIGGCASPVPLSGATGAEEPAGGTAETLPCANPKTVTPKPVPVHDAVFGLAVHSVDGRQALVPSWMFEVGQPGAKGTQSTFTVTYPAVRPQYIAPPSPGGEPGRGTGDQPGSGSAAPDRPATSVPVESYRADGRTLILRFWGGVCTDYSASAAVYPRTVRVRITGKDKKPGQVCIKIAKLFEKKVHLSQPLDGRTVVDATTGRAVPRRAGTPEPSTH
jgi:hypothetical protein